MPHTTNLLDPFIPRPDVRERHEIMIQAPAAIVFETACNFDLRSLWTVRFIFWLRARVLGARGEVSKSRKDLVREILDLGWGRLNEEPNRFFVAGAVCQPWQADVVFSPVAPERFAAYAEADQVKIAWTLETAAFAPALTCFATETRAICTDDLARTKFRRYWRTFGIGAMLIRRLLLAALRREAEQRWHRLARRAIAKSSSSAR